MMEKTFEIRAYGKGELAALYCPSISTPAACRKVNNWIKLYPNLTEKLAQAGFSSHLRNYTPAQVQLIVDALGEP